MHKRKPFVVITMEDDASDKPKFNMHMRERPIGKSRKIKFVNVEESKK